MGLKTLVYTDIAKDGGALGMASSLLGGLFGKSNTNKTNEMNYRIMQEQNRFNAEEAKKIVIGKN